MGGRGGAGSSGLGGLLKGVSDSGSPKGGEREGSRPITDLCDSSVTLDVMSPHWLPLSPTLKWDCVLNGQQNSSCTRSLGQ